MFTRPFAILLAWASFTGTAAAQVHPGSAGFASYDLRFGGMTIGHVVVVDASATGQPEGFAAGMEYWTWTDGPQWPGAFALARSSEALAYADHSWQMVDHGAFGSTDAEPMPELAMAPGDRLYVVQIAQETSSGFTFGDASYLWLMEGSAQDAELTWSWFGLADVLGTATTLDPGARVLRFQAVFEAPEAGSVEVMELR